MTGGNHGRLHYRIPPSAVPPCVQGPLDQSTMDATSPAEKRHRTRDYNVLIACAVYVISVNSLIWIICAITTCWLSHLYQLALLCEPFVGFASVSLVGSLQYCKFPELI